MQDKLKGFSRRAFLSSTGALVVAIAASREFAEADAATAATNGVGDATAGDA